MSTETTRSRENTRTRLLEAAAEVFAEVGISGASVEAICERAGFTRGAFYSNFETKDQLFLELADATGRRQLARVRERIDELADDGSFLASGDLTSLMRVLDTLGAGRDEVILMVESELRAMRDESFGEAMREQNARFLTEVTAIVEHVARVGNITLRLDAAAAARLLMAAWETTCREAMIAHASDDERNRSCHETVARVVQALIV